MSTLPVERRAELDRVQWSALVVGAVALAVCGVGAFFTPTQFFRSYLVAHQFFLGIALGSMAILMIYHLTRGAWGFMIRRLLEAAMRTLPLLAVLFVPVAFGVRYVYPWAQPGGVERSEELEFNPIYLDVPFWWLRAAVFFALWILLAVVLSLWSRQQDLTGEPHLPRKFRLFSAPGLVVYGLTITFASVDWVMSIQPSFHSTMFGVLYAVGQLLSAHAFALVLLTRLVSSPPLVDFVSRDTLNDLGNLLFTFLVLWAYLTFAQFMLIWMANLPEEVIWYLPRVRGGWLVVTWALVVFHFAVPFFALLMRDVKRNPQRLARVAGLLLVMQLVFLFYQIEPPFQGTTFADHWMDFLTPFGVGGIWLAFFLWTLRRRPVLPLHDLNRAEALHLRARAEELGERREAASHA
jgi:hypothetical protein